MSYSKKLFYLLGLSLVFPLIYLIHPTHIQISSKESTSDISSRAFNSSLYHHTDFITNFDLLKKFIFYHGKDSPGGDIIVLNKTVEQLKELCRLTEDCIGFTSDGHLKRIILPLEHWSHMQYVNEGLYVQDVDMCAFDNSKHVNCSNGAVCVNIGSGKYSCDPPQTLLALAKPPTADINHIHVVLSVDRFLLDGLLPLLQSIKEHCPNEVMTIHIVVSGEDRELVERKIFCSIVMPENIQIEFVTFDVPASFQQLIRIKDTTVEYLASTANFARFFFHQIFPSLSYIIYLDVDTLVLHKLGDLWKEIINSEQLFIGAHRKIKYASQFNHTNSTKLFKERYGKEMDLTYDTFNAGVVGFNLDKWRNDNVTGEVIYWMKEHSKSPLWKLGTQPILYIVGYENWKIVDYKWNVPCGYAKLNAIKSAYILHWSGKAKPWKTIIVKTKNSKIRRRRRVNGTYIWKKYAGQQECSNRGKCHVLDGKTMCQCANGSKGKICNHK